MEASGKCGLQFAGAASLWLGTAYFVRCKKPECRGDEHCCEGNWRLLARCSEPSYFFFLLARVRSTEIVPPASAPAPRTESNGNGVLPCGSCCAGCAIWFAFAPGAGGCACVSAFTDAMSSRAGSLLEDVTGSSSPICRGGTGRTTLKWASFSVPGTGKLFASTTNTTMV